MPLRPPSSELRARLQRLHGLSPEYGQQLSSHLPMALAALDALGADADRLDHFEAGYRATHRLVEQAAPGRALRDWPGLLGQVDALPDLRASLHRLLAEAGRDTLLKRTLPRLLDSPGAAAFHGLIRVAHALESGVDDELVEALAYWGARWQPLPDAPAADGAPTLDAAAWLDGLDEARRACGDEPESDLPLIAQRMRSAAEGIAWRALAARLDLATAGPEDSLAALARAAAARYLRSGNFTVLHMVTGVRAAAVVQAHCPLPPFAWPRLRDALAAASLVSGLWRTREAVMLADGPADWDTLVHRTVAQDDDHAIKLVHALRWWDERQPDPLWRRTAARALPA